MKAPWFPFYCGDFLASSDVQLMEAGEVGAYVLLLVHSWQSDTPGFLPNDENRLRRLARLSADAWKESRELLLSKWPEADDPTMRFNPRLKKEAEKQVQLRELKAEAGRKSAAKRTEAATQDQHKANRNPTGVEHSATGVAQNGNYSQSQSQPSKEGRKEGGQPAGQPSSLISSSENGKSAAVKGYPSQAEVFKTAGFAAYVTKMNFGHIDKGVYLPEIQRKAELYNQERDETGWENFVLDYLKKEKAKGRLLTRELSKADERTHFTVEPPPSQQTTPEAIAFQAKLDAEAAARTKAHLARWANRRTNAAE